MNGFFTLIEQLVSLTAPTIVVLQNLLGVTLLPVVNDGRPWHSYECHLTTGLISHVDYRVPSQDAAQKSPFLVLSLRNEPINLSDFRKRYGLGQPSDISVHHPHFIGHTFNINSRPVRIKADSKTDAVISISIDYSDQVDKKDGVQ